MPEVVGIQFLKGGGIHYFLPQNQKYTLDSLCVVEGDHGLQVARVVRANRDLPDTQVPTGLHPVLRLANARDLEQLNKNDLKEQDAYRLCRKKVKEKGLQMKLVDVSFTLDGRKAVFYFTAENRVDFRELVKELAQALKTKIEMRQIGVRDEARRLGGVGCCGRALCCTSFLRDFTSVSIRMAKEQNLSLNPTKVSGLCGRLMCCLAYEYEGTGQRGKKKCDPGACSGKCANEENTPGTKDEAVRAAGNPVPATANQEPVKNNPSESVLPKERPTGVPGNGPKPDPRQQKRRGHFRKHRRGGGGGFNKPNPPAPAK